MVNKRTKRRSVKQKHTHRRKTQVRGRKTHARGRKTQVRRRKTHARRRKTHGGSAGVVGVQDLSEVAHTGVQKANKAVTAVENIKGTDLNPFRDAREKAVAAAKEAAKEAVEAAGSAAEAAVEAKRRADEAFANRYPLITARKEVRATNNPTRGASEWEAARLAMLKGEERKEAERRNPLHREFRAAKQRREYTDRHPSH